MEASTTFLEASMDFSTTFIGRFYRFHVGAHGFFHHLHRGGNFHRSYHRVLNAEGFCVSHGSFHYLHGSFNDYLVRSFRGDFYVNVHPPPGMFKASLVPCNCSPLPWKFPYQLAPKRQNYVQVPTIEPIPPNLSRIIHSSCKTFSFF